MKSPIEQSIKEKIPPQESPTPRANLTPWPEINHANTHTTVGTPLLEP
jgi:hypothetical protein